MNQKSIDELVAYASLTTFLRTAVFGPAECHLCGFNGLPWSAEAIKAHEAVCPLVTCARCSSVIARNEGAIFAHELECRLRHLPLALLEMKATLQPVSAFSVLEAPRKTKPASEGDRYIGRSIASLAAEVERDKPTLPKRALHLEFDL